MTTCRRYVLEKRRGRKTKMIDRVQEKETNGKKRSDTHENIQICYGELSEVLITMTRIFMD